MTLHIIDVEQGTEKWMAARRGVVTASVVGQLITPTLKVADNDTSRALVRLLAAERITGYTDPTWQSDDMFRGVISEPVARDLYSEHYAPARECGFMRLERDSWTLGFSPDGLVGEAGLIEIKAPRSKEHLRTILADEVPDRYMAQCQAGLLVSGREWLDYVSFCGGMPLYVKRVTPDPRWHKAIADAAEGAEWGIRHIVGRYREATYGLPTTDRIDYSAEIVV